jgi:hypothetical protein
MFKDIGVVDLLLLAALIVALYVVRRAVPGSGIRAWHERHTSPRARARWHHVLLLEVTEIALSAIFLLVGATKLLGRPDTVALFHAIGIGQWFRYATGIVEVAGGALLLIPVMSGSSAVVLSGIMIVATLVELVVLHRPPVAAIACFSGHTWVGWARGSRRHLSWLVSEPTAPPAVSPSAAPLKTRWDFRRINDARRRRRQAAPAVASAQANAFWVLGNKAAGSPVLE